MNYCINCKKSIHCCVFSKGYAALYPGEARLIKKKTGLTYKDFLTYSRLPNKLVINSRKDTKYSEARQRSSMMINGKLLRLKTKKNKECVFLSKGKCVIYNYRPLICKLYPYWYRINSKGEIKIIPHASSNNCVHEQKNELNKKVINELIKYSKENELLRKTYKKELKIFLKELEDK